MRDLAELYGVEATAKKPLFVEVFSGSGRLSNAMKARGWHVKVWDVKHGVDFDLLQLSSLRRLLKLIKQAALVHIAPLAVVFQVLGVGSQGHQEDRFERESSQTVSPRSPARTRRPPAGRVIVGGGTGWDQELHLPALACVPMLTVAYV